VKEATSAVPPTEFTQNSGRRTVVTRFLAPVPTLMQSVETLPNAVEEASTA
jgi:hypothetical protein